MITVFRIDAPPTGIEVTGDGGNPTPDQIEEENKARQSFLDAVSYHLEALTKRPPHSFGNVEKVELLGSNVISRLNQYLLLVTVDIGDPRIDFDSFVPAGTTVTLIGSDFVPLAQWPNGTRA
ncbi:hypothetical protein BX265_7574 [Streptomyces sp. TLI_235]|nr:hypothetical protein [Streptomyces sp. TLI_235]PBC70178.1 hypothetical protein BX265_7574 [Streptomyces sp. TLI_235]